MAEKPNKDFYRETLKKWEDAKAKLVEAKDRQALRDWFDDTVSERCGLCKCYKSQCDKCPAFYSLICCRVSDSRLLIWKIWEASKSGNKTQANNLIDELLKKLKSLEMMFEEVKS